MTIGMAWSRQRVRMGLWTAAAALVAGCGGTPSGGGGDKSSVRVTPNPATVAVGASLQLQAVVTDAAGNPVSNPTVGWASSNTARASVTGTGLLRGVAVGSATITATSGTLSTTVPVTVTTAPPPGGLTRAMSGYLGGSLDEQIRDIATDAQGNVYLAGNTKSPDFPVTPGAYQTTMGTGGARVSDAWVMKLTPGGAVQWSTFLGGPNYERAYAVEVDNQGYVILAGRAGDGLPVTPGAFQTTFAGGPPSNAYGPQDGFVCKLTPNGQALVFCSYFGTSDGEIVRDVAVDSQGNIYVAAGSLSGTFPAAWFANAYQPTRAGGNDIIVAKIAPDGSQVLWATFLGGPANEVGTPTLRIAPDGSVVVLFGTNSSGLATPGGFQSALGGGQDLYLARLSSDGRNLLMATYIGGSGTDDSETHGLAIDSQGNIVVVASTTSPNLTTTAGAYQRAFGGGNFDGFVAKVAPTGALLACSYIGAGAEDLLEGVALDGSGNVFFAGLTNSATFPTTTGAGADGGTDLLALEFSADLSQLLFADRLGGSLDDAGRAAGLDGQGGFWVGGTTESSNFPTLNALRNSLGGGVDGAVVRYAPGP